MTKTLKYATALQLTYIRLQAVNAVTRDLAETGCFLTPEQVEDLGEQTIAWLGGRLGLNVKETCDGGAECTPPVHYIGRDEDGNLITAEDVA